LFVNPRDVAPCLSRKYSGQKLLETGKEFNYYSFSRVSLVVEKIKKFILKDKEGKKEC